MNQNNPNIVNIEVDELDLELDQFIEELPDQPVDLPTPTSAALCVDAREQTGYTGDTETPGPRNNQYPSARWWMGTSFEGCSDEMNEDETMVWSYFNKLWKQLKARALIGQIEKCPTTNRIHAQYAVRFDKTTRMSALKKLRKKDHFEIIRDRAASIKYCTKDETRYSPNFVKFGDVPIVNSKDTVSKLDWDEIFICAKTGRHSMIPSRIRLQYHSSISKLHQECQQRIEVSDCVRGVWLYGKPGLGKTRFVLSQYDQIQEHDGVDASTLYIKSLDRWWDGFSNSLHRNVFIDEVSPDHRASLAAPLKQWSDAMSFQAEVKGSKMVPKYDKLFVASNYTIKEFSSGDVALEKALKRRYLFIDWNQKESMIVTLPFPIYENGEIIDRVDVQQMVLMLKEIHRKYTMYSLDSISRGFHRNVSMVFVSDKGGCSETTFKISSDGSIVKLGNDAVTINELNNSSR